jgi:hypothetical protein
MTAMKMMVMKCVICERTRTRSAACERVAFGVSRDGCASDFLYCYLLLLLFVCY